MDFTNLDPVTFLKRYSADENAALIDVRTPEEFNDERIPEGVNINLMGPNFTEEILALDKKKNYYLYCRSGARSASACQFMASNAFEGSLFNLDGGILAWPGAKEGEEV